jgi:hypothetical protein
MPGELRTAFDFYQQNNERHQIAGLCAIVRGRNNLCLKEGNLIVICKPHYVESIQR